jgi:hypothetical protein
MTGVDTDPRTIALALARGRVVFGLVALLVPGLACTLLFGSSSPAARALCRMLGVRDLVLGVGAITSLKEQTQDAEWVSMGAVSDAVDSLAMWIAPIGWRKVPLALMSKGLGGVGLYCARRLADQRGQLANE